ncbi:MAG: GNAT family N-acetyltransferase [Chitinophagaceae bacterium]
MIEFNFKEEYILENERVLLRPLNTTDYENLLHFSLNEPELWKFSLVSGSSATGLNKYIQSAIDGRKEEKEYPFIVFDKQNNRFAGSTRFYDIQLLQKTLQLGYTWYGKDFQGSGLNKHCKFLLLSFAFEEMGLERVEFRADNLNKRSIAAMKSIGCIEEGVLRSNSVKQDGLRRDSIVLSILKGEWEDGVRQRLLTAMKQ